jgi:hypothetical protein
MKAGIVGVPLKEFLRVAQEVGLTIEPQKGFVKLTGNVQGLHVYPTNTNIVSEVHFSGFFADPKQRVPGLVSNPKHPKPSKKVTHFLDQREGLSSEKILENFRTMVTVMVARPVEPVQFEPVQAVAAEK